jgi:hypothetical protein
MMLPNFISILTSQNLEPPKGADAHTLYDRGVSDLRIRHFLSLVVWPE